MDETQDDGVRTALGRIVADETRWPAVLDLRPEGDDYMPHRDAAYEVANQRRLIFDLAMLPGADDEDGPGDEIIAEMSDPTSVYDMIAILCREVLRLRLELHELRWNEGPATN